MTSERAENLRIIAASVAAVIVFAIAGVALYTALEDNDAEVATTPGETTSSTEADPAETTSSTEADLGTTSSTEAPAPELIEVVFPVQGGLGFTQERTWAYDPATGVLENRLVFTTDLSDVEIAYTEVLPPSLRSLGDFEFSPEPAEQGGAGDSSTFKFRFKATSDQPVTMSWAVVAPDLTEADLRQLAEQRDAAEFAFLSSTSAN